MKIFKIICIIAAFVLTTALLSSCSSNPKNPGDRLVSAKVHADSKTVYYVGDTFDLNNTFVDIKVNLQFGGLVTLFERYNLDMNEAGFKIPPIEGFDSSAAVQNQIVTIRIHGSEESEFRGNISVEIKINILPGAQTFNADGITIKLPGSNILFTQEEPPSDEIDMIIFIANRDHIVFIAGAKEAKSDLPEGMTLREYVETGDFEEIGLDPSEIERYSDSTTTFDYLTYTVEEEVDGQVVSMTSLAIFIEGAAHFYQIEFMCLAEDYTYFAPTFMNWAKLITVQ